MSAKAISMHKAGYNCAQSVLASAGEYTGISEETALAISAGFGGGLRCGEVCGAVSGAVMALGQCFPYNNSDNLEAKALIAELAARFCADFKERFGALRCEDIVGDKSRCNEYISAASEILEKYIKSKGE